MLSAIVATTDLPFDLCIGLIHVVAIMILPFPENFNPEILVGANSYEFAPIASKITGAISRKGFPSFVLKISEGSSS